MEFPNDRLYSEDHLWVKVEQKQALIGITDYAKEELDVIGQIIGKDKNEVRLSDAATPAKRLRQSCKLSKPQRTCPNTK